MPINKHALIRYHALDRCFSNQFRLFFWEDLLEACNKALYEHEGMAEGVKRRQLFDDIRFMESEAGWSIPLGRYREGKRVYYRYEESDFSIQKQPLNANEASQIKSALLVMSRFKGLPQFEWIDELIPVVESKLGLVGNNDKVILFDSNIDYTGLHYITPLFHAIATHQGLKISYQDFKSDEPYDIIFHPQILKQYNNRWFVLGINEAREEIIWNMALDRIVTIEPQRKSYISLSIDWENDYLFDIVGVTKPENGELTEITLSIAPKLAPYIRTKPLHASQRGPSCSDGNWTLTIHVIPNYELTKMLLSFGDSIKVISPEPIKKLMMEELYRAINQYKEQ